MEISRVTRSKAEAKQTYSKLSRWYDTIANPSEARLRNMGLKALAARKSEHILEIGFGTGHGLLSLAQAVGETGRVCGVDLAKGMLTVASNRIVQAGLTNRVELKLGDGIELPFETNRFDAVFMCFTLELFDTPEIPLVLQECRRVLKPEGRIGVVSLSKKPGLVVGIYEWFHKKFPVTVDCRPIPAQQFLHNAKFYVLSATASAMWGLPIDIVTAEKM